MYLWRGVRPRPQRVSWYDIKQSHGNAAVMLELWGMRSTSSLPLLLGSLWPGVVAPERFQSMGQIELYDIWGEWKQITYAKLLLLHRNAWNHLTV